jgi:geranylgeranyl diphosphate synthase, type I
VTATLASAPGQPPGSSQKAPATGTPRVDAQLGESAEAADFRRYAEKVRGKVEAALDAWLTSKATETARLTPKARAPIEAAFDLARRGGKRLRAVLVVAAYEGFLGPAHDKRGDDAVLLAAVAMEMLQVYLLIHDDWMDGDELRRGGPSVPAMMRALFGVAADKSASTAPGLSEASAILAGDYAAGMAMDALASVPVLADRLVGALRELARVEKDVVAGQLLDVHTTQEPLNSSLGEAVELTHSLKTASYTVRAPVLIGARLAGASDEACRALEAYAEPLGVAFQLRDDVLGTFGDAKTTGKPAWSDLRTGKRTALIAEALRDPNPDPAAADLLRAVGDPDASTAQLEAVATYLTQSGARARVEARIEALLADARAALRSPSVPEAARLLLSGAIPALGRRES